MVKAHEMPNVRWRGFWVTPVFDYTFTPSFVYWNRQDLPFVSLDTNRDHTAVDIAPVQINAFIKNVIA